MYEGKHQYSGLSTKVQRHVTLRSD